MTGQNLSRTLVVQDPEQARLLSDPKTRRYFEPFLARERSASQAAAEIGCRLDTLFYRISKLRDAGLLEVVRRKKRAGKPIKIYRSSADEYIVPFEVTPFAEIEERLRSDLARAQESIIKGLAKSVKDSSREGRRIFRSEHGDVAYFTADLTEPLNRGDIKSFIEHAKTYKGRIGESFSDELRLKDADAKSLLVDLYELWERYRSKSEPPGKTYLLQAALVEL